MLRGWIAVLGLYLSAYAVISFYNMKTNTPAPI